MNKKTKILIIAHFYQPLNIIAAHRPRIWADVLAKNGFEPIIITRHWQGNEKNWDEILTSDLRSVSIEEKNGTTIYHLPFKNHFLYRIQQFRFINKSKILRNIVNLLGLLGAVIEIDRDTSVNYYKFCNEFIRKENIKFILTTSNPYSNIKLASRLVKNNRDLTWIADFRDLWNMDFHKENKKISFYLREKPKEFFIKRWMKQVKYVTVTNENFIKPLKNLSPEHTPFKLILNGYEEHLFDNFKDESTLNTKFTILCMGTLYLEQDISIFANCVNQLAHKVGHQYIKVKFLGANVNKAVSNVLKSKIDNRIIEITDFVDRKTAIQELKNCQLTFYPTWLNHESVIPGKIFEYLGAQKNILVLPNDHGFIEQLIAETNAGFISSDEEKTFEQLHRYFIEWQSTKTLPYHGKQEAIKKYTREHQSLFLLDVLNSFDPSPDKN